LKEVIIRIDFANPIEDLRYNIPNSVNLKALERFPIHEKPKTLYSSKFDIKISQDNKDHKIEPSEKDEKKQWLYFGKNREKRLEITKDVLIVVYSNYKEFASFKHDFIELYKSLCDEYQNVEIRRLGLRYVNVITLKEKSPTKWNKYLSSSLLCIFKNYENKESIARAFHTLDLVIEDIRLKFQYGISNSDFPAVIHKKEFILDYDAYYEGLITNLFELEEYIEKCRKPIKEMFESNIKEPLRKLMSNE